MKKLSPEAIDGIIRGLKRSNIILTRENKALEAENEQLVKIKTAADDLYTRWDEDGRDKTDHVAAYDEWDNLGAALAEHGPPITSGH